MAKKREGWYDEVRGRLTALERQITLLETKLEQAETAIGHLQRLRLE